MKIGVTQIILGKLTLDETLALCRDAGYEAVELVFSPEGDPNVEMSDDEVRGVKKRCDDAGIEISSALARYDDRGNFLSRDEADRDAGMKSLRRAIEVAHLVETDAVLLHPGQLPVEGTYEDAWDDFLTAMKAVAPYAEEKGVAVGIENVWNKFLLNPREAREFVDAVGSDWIGIYLDTANMMFYGYPEHWIRGLEQRIKRVHFKDFVRRKRDFVPLMEGDTDWAEVMKGLRDIGYDRYAIHEVGGGRDVQIEMAKRMKQIVAL